jgi:hypothetical protein
MINRSRDLVSDRHLIVIQDTTSFNFNCHYHRLKKDTGLGPIEDNFTLGFFLHASLVVDAFTDTVLGLSDIQLWHRVYDDPKREAKIKGLPIEQKESYKWLKACDHAKRNFGDAASITFVEDRDGDIYEQFAVVPDLKTHFVIRNCKERRLANGSKLFETVSKQRSCGNYTLDIKGDQRTKKSYRKACLDIRFVKVSLRKPADHPNKTLAETADVYAVEAKESKYNGKDKVCWKLLTTHPVTCFEDALSVIEIYKKRWYIEQLFRLLKKQGFEMESSQLESGWALRKLCVLALNTVVRVMQLMLATEEEGQSANHVFNTEEQSCLQQVNNQYKGTTEKQSNPYKKDSLLWAKWIIARLGGWKGYSSQRVPGPITLKRGIDKFNQIFNGWCLALKLYEDVGTQ